MAIPIKCANQVCNKTLRVKDEHAGKTLKCPGCGAAIRVPNSPSSTTDIDPEIDWDAATREARRAHSEPQRPKNFTKLNKNKKEGSSELGRWLSKEWQTVNPLNSGLPYWQQGGFLSIYAGLPIFFFIAARSSNSSVGVSIVASVVMMVIVVPLVLLVTFLYLALVRSENILLKIIGFSLTPLLVPVFGISAAIFLPLFMVGAFVGLIIGVVKPTSN